MRVVLCELILIEVGVGMDEPTDGGNTALCKSIRDDHMEIFEVILAQAQILTSRP